MSHDHPRLGAHENLAEKQFVGEDSDSLVAGQEFLCVKEDAFTSQISSSSSSPVSEGHSFPDDRFGSTCLADVAFSGEGPVSDSTPRVPLEPFVHQVGGHFPMVCLATDTICKPLNDREHNFYRTLPVVLQPYTPKFEGVMSVSLHEDENGYITLMGTPPDCYGKNKSSPEKLKSQQQILKLHHHIQQLQLKDYFSSQSNSHKIRFKRTDSIEIERGDSASVSRSISVPASTCASPREKCKMAEDSDFNGTEVFPALTATAAEAHAAAPHCELTTEGREEIFCNPWALKCHRDHLKKLGLLSSAQSSQSGESNSPTSFANNATQLYLLLENLVSKYTRPCVLDLKVGSRQYADDVSAAKKQRKIDKSANSTSATLGLRLCGMQVYNASTGKYLCHNKYYGRTLSPDGFKRAISQFLNNTDDCRQLRFDVINKLVEKLKWLIAILKQLDTFRFYTSSLLVTYDGASRPGFVNPSAIVDVRIIDFAHSTHEGLKDSTLHVGPDEGFILGIENFVKILNEIKSGVENV